MEMPEKKPKPYIMLVRGWNDPSTHFYVVLAPKDWDRLPNVRAYRKAADYCYDRNRERNGWSPSILVRDETLFTKTGVAP